MGILDFLRNKPKSSANVARERLRIIVAQERSTRNAPDYLPMLRGELLEVIRKYINVEADEVQIKLEHDGNNELLELSVLLPDVIAPK